MTRESPDAGTAPNPVGFAANPVEFCSRLFRSNTVPPHRAGNGGSEGWLYVRTSAVLRLFTVVTLTAGLTTTAAAQEPRPAPPEVASAGATQAATPNVDNAADQAARPGGTGQTDNAESQQAPPAKVAPPQTGQASSRQAAIEQEQAAKVPTLHPYVPNKAEGVFDRLDKVLEGGGLTWHPFFESAYSGGGLHARRRLHALRQRLQHARRARQLSRSRATSASRPSSSRRACSTAAARSRCSAAGARRRRSASTGSARTRRWTTGPTTASSSRTGRRSSTSGRRAAVLMLRGGVELSRSGSRSPVRARRRRSKRSTRPRRCRASARQSTYLHTQGTVGLDWRDVARLHAPRRLLRRHAATTTPTRTTPSASTRWTTRRSSTSRSCARPGCSRSTAACRPRTTRTASRFRSSCCRRSAADRRCAGTRSWRFRDRTACCCRPSGACMVNRFFDIALFYDAGKVAARTTDLDLNGLKNDYGIGVPLPRAGRRRRCASSWRRATKASSLVFSASAVVLR